MPYPCDLCSKKFGSQEKLQRHKLKQHPSVPSAKPFTKPEGEAKAGTNGEQPRKVIKVQAGRIIVEAVQAVMPKDMVLTKDERATIEDACDVAASAAGLEIEPIETTVRLSGWTGLIIYLAVVFLPILIPRLILHAQQERERQKQIAQGELPHDGPTARPN